MFDWLVATFKDLMSDPTFKTIFGFGVGGGLMAGVAYKFQAVLTEVWYWIDRLICTKVIVNNQNYCPAFWFIDDKFKKENDYVAMWNGGGTHDSEPGMGPGVFYRWYRNRPLVVRKRRVEQQTQHYYEIEIKTWFNRKLKYHLKEDKDKNQVRTMSIGSKNLRVSHEILNDVYLPTEASRTLYDKLKRIQELWEDGKSVRASFLLYGEPGGGKSQAIKNICVALGVNMKVLYLDPKMNNMTLVEDIAFADRTVILLEDIDRYDIFTGEKDSTSDCQYNKAGILNMLDGVLSPKNIVVIGTTNNINQLDKAILRSGRFDTHLEFARPTRDDVVNLFSHEMGRAPMDSEIALLDNQTLATVYKNLNDLIIDKYECKKQKKIKSPVRHIEEFGDD
jgi:hypothetical protein